MSVMLSLTLVSVGPQPALHAQATDELQVRAVMDAFVTAFNNLDWEAFRPLWVERPVVFFPFADDRQAGERIDTPDRFDEVWRRLFERIKANAAKGGAAGPPYQNIQPRDLRVDFPSRDTAVVTFHLGNVGGNIGRRLFILARNSERWQITHLHASNLTIKPAP